MKIIKIAQQKGLNLPPIPDGMVRLTHFSKSQHAVKNIMEGGDFQYGSLIATTTDLFESNKSILSLIEKGTYSNYDRGSFGDFVFLMDVPEKEYGIHNSVSYIKEGVIKNGCILGYVDRKSMKFYLNGGYNPASVPPLEYEVVDMKKLYMEEVREQPIPSPASDFDAGDVF